MSGIQHKRRQLEDEDGRYVDLEYLLNNIGFNSDTRNFDAFGRFRVCTPFTVYDIKQNTSNQPLFYDDAETDGSGTASLYLDYKGATRISVSANTAGTRVRQTKTWAQYQPGKSQMILMSANFRGSVPGVSKKMGMFNELYGLYYDLDGDGMHVCVRTYNTGAATQIRVNQSDWNKDTLDGNGPSGITLDFSKVQLGFVDYEWLGVGRVHFGFVIDGLIYYCHEIKHTNIDEEIYMSNPNAPLRYEISNDGSGADAYIDTMCVSVQSEGGQESSSITTYLSRNGTPCTLANQDIYTPVLSARLKATRPCTRVQVRDVSILLTTNTNYEWVLFLNPDIAGTDTASWVPVPGSAMEYDISRTATNAVTGGYRVDGGYGASSAQARMPAGQVIQSFLTIGTNIDGSQDEYVLAVKNVDANGGSAYAGITVGEYC